MKKALIKWIKPIVGGRDFNMPYGPGSYGSTVGRPEKKKNKSSGKKKKSSKKKKKK